jgi:hypothetical protein
VSLNSYKGWGEEVALLVLTYSKLEYLLPEVRGNLDLFWASRPKTFYVTDGSAIGEDVFVERSVNFVELLGAAIKKLRNRCPQVTHVVLLLEDLCPLSKVDDELLQDAFSTLCSRQKKFMTVQWPVHEGYVWKRDSWATSVGAITSGRVNLTRIPFGWDAFNSLVVCFWDLEYLEGIIYRKIGLGLGDPWSFEHPLPDQFEEHYLLQDAWPTYNNGFMWNGEFNSKCVTRRYFPPSPLLSALRREYCGYDSLVLSQISRHSPSGMPTDVKIA